MIQSRQPSEFEAYKLGVQDAHRTILNALSHAIEISQHLSSKEETQAIIHGIVDEIITADYEYKGTK